MRISVPVFVALFAVAAPVSAQTNLTGNWSGTYTYSLQLTACPGKTFSSNGNVNISFLQTGAALQGRADLTDALIFNGNCNPTKGEQTTVVYGAIDGSTVSWAFPNDPSATLFTGTVTGDTITAQFTDNAGGTGMLSITRSSPDPLAVDSTGSWSGTYSFVDRCSNGATQTYSGTLTLGLTQATGRVTGVATLQNVPLYDSSCKKITALNQTMSVSGTVSGSTLNAAVFDPSGSFDFPIVATVNSSGISGTVMGANQTATTGSFMLTRSDATPPAADFAGSYDGTYDETDNEAPFCFNVGSLHFTGSATISVAQAGNAVAGLVVFHDGLDVQSDGFGNCFPVSIGDETIPLYGPLSNGVLNVVLPFGSGSIALKVTFSGTMIQGSLTDSVGDVATFTGTKTVLPAPAPPGPRRRVVRP